MVKFLYELLGRTIMVNPCLSILGNDISHHTCFPRMLSVSYQQIELMSSMSFPLLMSLELGWPLWLWPIKYGRCEARRLWNEVIKIQHTSVSFSWNLCSWNQAVKKCVQVHREATGRKSSLSQILKAREDRCLNSKTGRESTFFFTLPFCSILTTHIKEGNQLCLVYRFKC